MNRRNIYICRIRKLYFTIQIECCRKNFIINYRIHLKTTINFYEIYKFDYLKVSICTYCMCIFNIFVRIQIEYVQRKLVKLQRVLKPVIRTVEGSEDIYPVKNHNWYKLFQELLCGK